MTHTEAVAKFKRCHSKTFGYLLAKNTRLQKRGNAFAVRLHKTDIVMIRPDGTYRLNTNGRRSVSTKDRINSFSPCTINQTNGIWHIGNTPYRDGMLVNSVGIPVETHTHTIDEVTKAKRRVDRLSTKFIKIVVTSTKYKDIGVWSLYRKRSAPLPNNKVHLTKLWNIVLMETSKNDATTITDNHLFIWIYLASADNYYRFRNIRNNAMDGRHPSLMLKSLTSFMCSRKPHIAEMIISGELSDGTVRIS